MLEWNHYFICMQRERNGIKILMEWKYRPRSAARQFNNLFIQSTSPFNKPINPINEIDDWWLLMVCWWMEERLLMAAPYQPAARQAGSRWMKSNNFTSFPFSSIVFFNQLIMLCAFSFIHSFICFLSLFASFGGAPAAGSGHNPPTKQKTKANKFHELRCGPHSLFVHS